MIPFPSCSDVRITIGSDFGYDVYMLRIDFLRTKEWITIDVAEEVAKKILALIGESEGLANE